MRARGRLSTVIMLMAGVVVASSPPVEATVVKVTDSGDAGPGTFRAAIVEANGDASIHSITFAKNLGTVALASTVTYTGTQSLSIDGRGGAIEPGVAGAFDLFVADGGADLVVKDLTVRDAEGNGIVVSVPSDADGTVSVKLSGVGLHGNDLSGLLVSDVLASSAGIELDISSSSFTGNGRGEGVTDFDAIRVSETGEGSIVATVKHTASVDNGGDGLELDEAGDGGVSLTAMHCSFDDNGDQDPDDLEDGVDIDEVGEGSVSLSMIGCTVNGNRDEGIDLDEADGGDLDVSLVAVDVQQNDCDGVKIGEEGEGDLTFKATTCRVVGNADKGIELEEADGGDVDAEMRDLLVADNGDDGVDIVEDDDGDLFVRVVSSDLVDNDQFGIKVEQDDDGEGTLRLQSVMFGDNGDGDFDAEGVDVIEIP